jgi:hypothetical protein
MRRGGLERATLSKRAPLGFKWSSPEVCGRRPLAQLSFMGTQRACCSGSRQHDSLSRNERDGGDSVLWTGWGYGGRGQFTGSAGSHASCWLGVGVWSFVGCLVWGHGGVCAIEGLL